MTLIEAKQKGFTVALVAECYGATLNLLVRPNEDLDGQFKAFDRDNGEMLAVRGWMFDAFELGTAHA